MLDGSGKANAASGVLLGLSSIYWREAWKYGMRAWRYCQHDCGHAIAALSYAAAMFGWQTRLLASASDELVSALLGLDREADLGDAEPEAPDALLWVGLGTSRPKLEDMPEELRDATWSGRANRLSAEHMRWPDIDSIHRATRKLATSEPAAYPITIAGKAYITSRSAVPSTTCASLRCRPTLFSPDPPFSCTTGTDDDLAASG